MEEELKHVDRVAQAEDRLGPFCTKEHLWDGKPCFAYKNRFPSFKCDYYITYCINYEGDVVAYDEDHHGKRYMECGAIIYKCEPKN